MATVRDDGSPFGKKWFTNLLIGLVGIMAGILGKMIYTKIDNVSTKVDMIIEVQYDIKSLKEKQEELENNFKDHVAEYKTQEAFSEAEKRLKLKYK